MSEKAQSGVTGNFNAVLKDGINLISTLGLVSAQIMGKPYSSRIWAERDGKVKEANLLFDNYWGLLKELNDVLADNVIEADPLQSHLSDCARRCEYGWHCFAYCHILPRKMFPAAGNNVVYRGLPGRPMQSGPYLNRLRLTFLAHWLPAHGAIEICTL